MMSRFDRLSIPDWIPLNRLIPCVVVAVIAVGTALGMWAGTAGVEWEISEAEKREAVQSTLGPVIARIRAAQRTTEKEFSRMPPMPTPSTLTAAINAMSRLGSSAGLTRSQFVPDAETVAGNSSIRLTGTCEGDSESLRRFMLILSDLTWVESIEKLDMKAQAESHRIDITLWVNYGRASAGAKNTGSNAAKSNSGSRNTGARR